MPNFYNFAFNPTVGLAFALMAVIIMMILPVPALFLDIGLAASFTLSVLIFTVTLFISKPLDFSAFPTVLLASLMLRLSLNVSSTKLIIGQGHTGTSAAGGVIEGFANFIMGGSIFLGLVVFCVLLIVNFVVITKGAARMAEVGARFALDGMPGKQMAIDSDIAAGAITHEQAAKRRELEQQETTFFGSLDGASKFVKGDAIAGLLIILLNLVAGLIMGVVVHNMQFAQAFQTYAILTVGDGLVSQIPAVIISIASALLLARGREEGSTDLALLTQLGRHPAALYSVSVAIFGFALVPGLPFIPFVLIATLTAGAGYLTSRRIEKQAKQASETVVEDKKAPEPTFGDLLELDEIHVEFSTDLVNMILDPATGLDVRIINMRKHIISQYGIIIPEIRLSDNPGLQPGRYSIRLLGVEHSTGYLEPKRLMMLLPDEAEKDTTTDSVKEPVYGAPAKWIDDNMRQEMVLEGHTVVTPSEILATHLLETIRQNLSRLLTYSALGKILTELTNVSSQSRAEANKKLFDDIIPDKVSIDLLLSILKMLLDEQVSIRNIPLILESIVEAKAVHATQEGMCEYVRQKLGFQLISVLKRDDGSIPLLQLAPEWEETFANYQVGDARSGIDVALPPNLFNSLAENIGRKISEVNESGIQPAIITSAVRRRFIHTLLKAKGISAPVLSFEEVGTEANPALVGMISA